MALLASRRHCLPGCVLHLQCTRPPLLPFFLPPLSQTSPVQSKNVVVVAGLQQAVPPDCTPTELLHFKACDFLLPFTELGASTD